MAWPEAKLVYDRFLNQATQRLPTIFAGLEMEILHWPHAVARLRRSSAVGKGLRGPNGRKFAASILVKKV